MHTQAQTKQSQRHQHSSPDSRFHRPTPTVPHPGVLSAAARRVPPRPGAAATDSPHPLELAGKVA